MKRMLALAVFCLALAAFAPVGAEPGDPPGRPWKYMSQEQVRRLEKLREEQIVGGVRGSPYWLWQAYLGSGSLSLRLYEVSDPIFPTQLLFKERVTYPERGIDRKAMFLEIQRENAQVEIRLDAQALDLLEQAGIATITVKNSTGDALCAYSCEDLRAVYDFFALKEGETLCVQGEQAPVYAYSEDGVRRVLSVDYKAP